MKYFIPFLLLLVSCGLPVSHDNGPTPPPIAGCNRPNAAPAKATLVLFGAPPCSNCHVAFPEIANQLNALSPELQQSLKVTVYVETGGGWTDGPTQAISQAYANSLHLCADLVSPDSTAANHHPSYAKYLEYMGSDQEATLPAAVVLDKSGKVVDKFYAGSGFVPVVIVNRAVAEAQK
jgi:hypothetical protein